MSAFGKVKTYWDKATDQDRRPKLLVIGVSVFAVVVVFKAKPYLADHPEVKAFVRESGRAKQTDGSSPLGAFGLLTKDSGSASGRGLLGGGDSARSTLSRASVAKVLERPLFDGKNVTLKVRLQTALDSDSGDAGVEGQILAVLDSEQASSMDAASVKLGVLRGAATPNFETKRYMTQFRELLTADGKTIGLTGVAYTPSDSMPGIPAEYSSGLPSRLIGTALNRVIVAADTVAESHVLDDGSGSAVDRELGRLARQGSSETANGLGDEASKGLRETKATLRVQAGTIIYVKTQVSRGAGGGR